MSTEAQEIDHTLNFLASFKGHGLQPMEWASKSTTSAFMIEKTHFRPTDSTDRMIRYLSRLKKICIE